MEGRNDPEGGKRKRLRWNDEGMEGGKGRRASARNDPDPDPVREGSGDSPGTAHGTSRKVKQSNLLELGIYRRTASRPTEEGYTDSGSIQKGDKGSIRGK